MPGQKLSMLTYIPLQPHDTCLCGSSQAYSTCCQPKRDWYPVCPNLDMESYRRLPKISFLSQSSLGARGCGNHFDPETGDEHWVSGPMLLIDSPGTRALPRAQQQPEVVMNPVKIAEAFYYLHSQDKSCWTHELQLTPYPTKPSF